MKLQRGHAGSFPPLGPDGSAVHPPAHAGGTPSNLHSNRDEQFIRLNLLRALQLHRRLALGFAVAGVLFALVYAIITWPVYIAKSQIYVQPVQPKVMTPGSEQNSSVNAAAYDAYIQQQVQGASNPSVLLSAMNALGPGAWQHENESEAAAAERLGHAVEAARIGTGYEVAITAHASDPELAAKIANAVANSIAEKASGEGNAGDSQRIAVLREERDRIQNELKSDYAEQDDLNRQLGMASVGTAPPDMIDDQIAKTREELIKAQTDHDQAEAKFSTMRAVQGGSSAALDAEADDMIAADPGLSSMKTSLNQRRAVLITQMANLTPDNPAYRLAADELAKINTSLDAMMNDLRSKAAALIHQKLRTDLERTARVEDQLNGQLRQLAHEAAGATPKLQRVNDLATDIVRLRNRYSLVDEQLHNLLLEDSAPGAVHISVAAVPPLHPSLGKLLKGVLPLVLGGLILGLLAAVIANKLDPRVYIAADVEEALGSAPMAVLPDFGEVSEAAATEYLLRLAAVIDHASRKGDLQTCIFTGTSRYTGVTTVAERVRDHLAIMGRRAALLDTRGNTLRDIHTSEVTALRQKTSARAELAPDTLVLVDTAPLMLSAETEYLARSVDGAIVVVESGVTTREQLLAAINTLQRLEIGAVGFVLNRVKQAKADPLFRQSLHDMEKHLFSQSASGSMWPVSWHGIIEEPKPKPNFTGGENALPAKARTAVEPAAQRDSVETYQWPQPAFEQVAHPKAVLPKDEQEPWRLSSSARDPEAAAPACATEPIARDYPAAVPPHIQPPMLPDWFWERGSGGSGDFMHLPASEGAEQSRELAPPNAESRMDRIRRLFTDARASELNRKHVTQPVVEPEPEANQPDPEPAAMPVNVSKSVPDPKPAAIETEVKAEMQSTTQAIAEPEVLSPREFIPVQDPHSKSNGTSRAESSNDDEIRILPSKRGQYRSQ